MRSQQNGNYPISTESLRIYSLRQYLIYSYPINRITIKSRSNQIRKTSLAIPPFANNLLPNYRPLSSILQITWQRGLLSLVRPSPILFIKKLNRGLRFYINYYKLNNITRKDRYPLPLLDKTLAYINRAKVFIKLDIRQAFY